MRPISETALLSSQTAFARLLTWVGGLAAIGGLCVLRVATDAEFLFMSAVLLPIMAVCWTGGLRSGLYISAIASGAWAIADLQVVHRYSAGWIPLLNGLTSFVVYATFSGLLVLVRNAMRREAEMGRLDPLTQALNRRAFLEAGATEWRRACRYGTPLALAYVDLDRFKLLNDTRGHDAGDAALQAVGRALQGAVRETDTLARLGGDEFAVILPSTTEVAARDFAARVQQCLRDALAAYAPVTASVGVVCDEGPPRRSFESALKAADELMYRCKRQGGNASGCQSLASTDARADAASMRPSEPNGLY